MWKSYTSRGVSQTVFHEHHAIKSLVFYGKSQLGQETPSLMQLMLVGCSTELCTGSWRKNPFPLDFAQLAVFGRFPPKVNN